MEATALGSMEAAQIKFAKVFMAEKLLMEDEDLERMTVEQACFTGEDTLAVKFGSREDIRRINKYKKRRAK